MDVGNVKIETAD